MTLRTFDGYRASGQGVMMVLRAIGLAALLLTVAGCAGLPASDDALRVTVSDIRVLESTLLEQSYEVTLRIQNRRAQEIAINGGSFDLEINGRDFGSGVSDSQVTIAGYSDAKIDVQMISTLFDMLRLVHGLQDGQGGALEYEISGHLSVAGRFGRLGFSEVGEVSFLERRKAD